MRSQHGSVAAAGGSSGAVAARGLPVVMPMSAIMSALLTYFGLVVNPRARYHKACRPSHRGRTPLSWVTQGPYRESRADAKGAEWAVTAAAEVEKGRQ